MKSKFIPVYNLNVPNGGPQGPPLIISGDQPVFSSYTGELICNGPVLKGTICDAPIGHANYGKPFHVIEFNPVNGSLMGHNFFH